MKNLFKGIAISLAFALSIGAGVVSLAHSSRSETKQTEATSQLVYNPAIVSDYNTSTGQSWSMSGDPSAGQSSDYSVYSTSLNGTTTGYTHSSAFTVTSSGGTSTNTSTLKATSSMTKGFLAQYIPCHISLSIPARTKASYNISLSISAGRSTNDKAGGADYSTELFWYGETAATPSTWFYHQDDFTPSTGRGYSVYRVANGVHDSTASHDGIAKSFVLENNTSSSTYMNIYFGIFCYVESSGTLGAYTGIVGIDSTYVEYTNAVASVNDTNYYTEASALSAYNATASSTMIVLTNLDFSATHYSLSSAGGSVNLNGYTIDLGNRVLYIAANTTITGSSGSKITSTFAYGTIAINTAATLNLYNSAVIENTCTDTQTARAVLLGNENAKLFVGQNAQITSNYYGVQIDDGYLYNQGKILYGNSTYAVVVGSSDTANKYIYLYGSYAQATKIRSNNPAKTYIYASYNSTSYTASSTVSIELNGTYSLNDIVVRSVSDSNYTKFSLVSYDYQLSKSGSNLIVAYRSYSVTYNLSNCTRSGGTTTASRQNNLSFTLIPNEDCHLPATISIMAGSTTLVVGTNYTYNQETGAVLVYKEYITGNITISVLAIEYYTIRFCNTEGEEVAETIQVAKNQSFTLPYPTIHPAYYSACMWMDNQDLSGGGVGAGHSVFANQGNKTYYAKYSRIERDYVDEFVGIQLHFDVDIIDEEDQRNTGACLGNTGYYQVAKTAYNALTSSLKQLFCTDSSYAKARARLKAWANANGEDLNLSNYQLEPITPSNALFNGDKQATNTAVVVTVCSLLSVISLAAFIIARRKRFN